MIRVQGKNRYEPIHTGEFCIIENSREGHFRFSELIIIYFLLSYRELIALDLGMIIIRHQKPEDNLIFAGS